MSSATGTKPRSLEELAHEAMDGHDPHIDFGNFMKDGVLCEPQNFDDVVRMAAQEVRDGLLEEEREAITVDGEYSMAWFKVIENLETSDGSRDFALGQIIVAMFRLAAKRADLDEEYTGD